MKYRELEFSPLKLNSTPAKKHVWSHSSLRAVVGDSWEETRLPSKDTGLTYRAFFRQSVTSGGKIEVTCGCREVEFSQFNGACWPSILQAHCKYRLGLSGTVSRLDCVLRQTVSRYTSSMISVEELKARNSSRLHSHVTHAARSSVLDGPKSMRRAVSPEP